MSNIISTGVYDLVKKVVPDDIGNYSIEVHNPNRKGEGYLGEVCFISLKDKNSDRVFNLVVKEAFSDEIMRSKLHVRDIFLNEIYFYNNIWPCFLTFQKEASSVEVFDKIPKCLAMISDENSEKIVLENIKFQNFQIFKKNKTFDKQQVEYLFKEYGKFHALSFAYRALHPKEYSILSKGLKNIYCEFTQIHSYRRAIEMTNELCLKSLQPGRDDGIIEKYKHYVENGLEIFWKSSIYTGQYSAILHGDCWSNNMMFKYDELGNFTDMRFLDFQLAKEGTPVSDLSYCLYSGTSKVILNELDYYLRVYHNSLSQSLKDFGCNSDDLYPFEMLKNDWKVNCRFGFTMALFLWRSKLTYEEEETEADKKYFTTEYDEDTFKERTRDLILHMYENDFL